MLLQIGDMPGGALVFEAVGTFDDDDFEDVVEPDRSGDCGGERVRRLRGWQLRSSDQSQHLSWLLARRPDADSRE